MADNFTAIDLSALPAPNVVEALDYEDILAAMLADLRDRDETFNALVESDPAYKILEVAAYRELLIRQRVNDAARGVMIAYATGADLDHIAARYGIARLEIAPEDDTTIPPTPAIYESDDDLRARTILSFEGYSSAGSVGGYVFFALSADGDVKSAEAVSPSEGMVTVYVLSRTGNGAASAPLLAKVEAALSAQYVRPLTDQVTVLSASITTYSITAELVVYPGPDRAVVQAAALAALQKYVGDMHRIGYDVTLSGIYSALHQPGVQRVNLSNPTADISVASGQAAYCTAINLTSVDASDV